MQCNIPAVTVAIAMTVVCLSMGVTGLVVKGAACGNGVVSIDNWIQIAGICYCVAAGLFFFVLVGIFLDWAWVMFIALGTELGLFIMTVFGVIALASGESCAVASSAIWSAAMAQVITYFISLIIFAVGFVLACNAA